MDRNSQLILRKICIDVVTLLAVGFPILGFFLFGKSRRRGFFCNDESLKYPYRDSTVSSMILYIVGSGLPLTVMVISEFVIGRNSGGQSTLTFMDRPIPPWVVKLYKFIGVFAFGAACSQLTTDIAKYLVGRLRPHFFEVCVPNVDCSLPENQHKYMEHYTCQGSRSAHIIKDVGLSFPSGHSSFSAYTMLFLACYVQCRIRWKGSKLLRHGVQFLCLMLSWGTAMSRISDYKHHWSDVLGGLVIGCTTAALTVRYVSDLVMRKYDWPAQQTASQHPPGNGVALPDYFSGNDIHALHGNPRTPGSSDLCSSVNERSPCTPLLSTSTTKYGSKG